MYSDRLNDEYILDLAAQDPEIQHDCHLEQHALMEAQYSVIQHQPVLSSMPFTHNMRN